MVEEFLELRSCSRTILLGQVRQSAKVGGKDQSESPAKLIREVGFECLDSILRALLLERNRAFDYRKPVNLEQGVGGLGFFHCFQHRLGLRRVTTAGKDHGG